MNIEIDFCTKRLSEKKVYEAILNDLDIPMLPEKSDINTLKKIVKSTLYYILRPAIRQMVTRLSRNGGDYEVLVIPTKEPIDPRIYDMIKHGSGKRLKGTPPNKKQGWPYFLKSHDNDFELIKEKYSIFCHLVVLFLNTKVVYQYEDREDRSFPEYYFIKLFNTIPKLTFVESLKQLVRSESITLEKDRFKIQVNEDKKAIKKLKQEFGNYSRMIIKNLDEDGKQNFLLDDNAIDRRVPYRQTDYCRGKMNGMSPHFEEQFQIASPRDYELALRVLLDKYNTLHERFVLERREKEMHNENMQMINSYQERGENIPTRDFPEDGDIPVNLVSYDMPEFNEEVYEQLKKISWKKEWNRKFSKSEFDLFQKRQKDKDWNDYNKVIYRYYPALTLAFINEIELKWRSRQIKFGREVHVMKKIQQLERLLHMFLNSIYMENGDAMTFREFVAKSSLASKLRILRREIKNFKGM